MSFIITNFLLVSVMDGSLPRSLKHIISNAEYYGPSLFLLGKIWCNKLKSCKFVTIKKYYIINKICYGISVNHFIIPIIKDIWTGLFDGKK